MSFFNRFSFLLVPIIFFIVSLFTLYDYGINWDSPSHFARGQAYLRYILTGKTDYKDLPSYCLNEEHLISRVDFETGEICDRHRKVRVSQYESSLLDYDQWASKNVYGHPAFSNLMMAASNNIFYKTLGWVEDIDSYHLYSIFTTFILALTVSIWTKQTFGTFASIIAVLTVYTFPLLFGEQHFNVKDPPMAAFFTLSLYLFWLSVVKKKPLFLFLSALAAGASFGTKFNFVFAPFILLPWIIFYGVELFYKKTITTVLSKKMLFIAYLYPAVIFLVFFLSWPAMWSDPFKNVPQVFNYYQDIGGSSCNHFVLSISWFKECVQIISFKYLVYTTAPFTLFLLTFGMIVSIFWFKKYYYLPVLLLSFFLITLLRVTFPISSIYGGIRQIIEFIGPMAMLTGTGALFLRDFIFRTITRLGIIKNFNKENVLIIISAIIISGYIPVVSDLIRLHPNQNVYFNSLIGGLKGAAAQDFPGYGNTYGNAYLQGINWLNQHAEKNSKFALVLGNTQNIPRGIIREDIPFGNGYRSGYSQLGEYQMMLITSQDNSTETFKAKYLETFLNPVFNLKVDEVSILKIWKNSKNHLKDGHDLDEIKENIETRAVEKDLLIKLTQEKRLKTLTIRFTNSECRDKLIEAEISISDDGNKYAKKVDNLNGFAEEEIRIYRDGSELDFVYLFPGDEAKFIKISPPQNYPCRLTDFDFSVLTFSNLR